MIKTCVICGEPFTCSPSDKKVTCARPAYIAERKRLAHLGKSNAWSEEAKQQKSAQGQTPNLRLGTPAAQHSPIAGPFETNQQAKRW